VTAEYGMLPRSTHDRMRREAARRQTVRPHPGDSAACSGPVLARGVAILSALGERQITIDCDVLQADGGTRTAAVTGGFVALAQCVAFMKKIGMVSGPVIKDHVAAVSCGIFKGTPVLDLDYDEDLHRRDRRQFCADRRGRVG